MKDVEIMKKVGIKKKFLCQFIKKSVVKASENVETVHEKLVELSQTGNEIAKKGS